MTLGRIEFPLSVKKAAYERSGGNCEMCGIEFGPDRRPQYHHDIEAGHNGKPTLDNCLCICVTCHRRVTKWRRHELDKTRRLLNKQAGLTGRKQKIPNRGWQR